MWISFRRSLRTYAFSLAILFFFFAAWELFVTFSHVPRFLLVGPLETLVFMSQKPTIILGHGFVTAYETAGGCFLGIVFGVLTPIAMVYSRFLKATLYPLIVASQVIPKVAIAPFVLLWLGQGAFPKMVIAFILTFFPMVVNTSLGMESVPPEMIDLAKSLQSNTLKTFTKIRLPHALPYIFGGLKVSISLALIGAILGEFLAGNDGLGYLIVIAIDQGNLRLLFSAVLLSFALAICLFGLVVFAEKKIVPWAIADKKEDKVD